MHQNGVSHPSLPYKRRGRRDRLVAGGVEPSDLGLQVGEPRLKAEPCHNVFVAELREQAVDGSGVGMSEIAFELAP
jgi:hypothetical protein